MVATFVVRFRPSWFLLVTTRLRPPPPRGRDTPKTPNTSSSSRTYFVFLEMKNRIKHLVIMSLFCGEFLRRKITTNTSSFWTFFVFFKSKNNK